jgi:hypothetical protein
LVRLAPRAAGRARREERGGAHRGIPGDVARGGCRRDAPAQPPDVFSFAGAKQPANLLVLAGAAPEPTLFVRRGREFVEEDIAAPGFPVGWLAEGQSFREVAARLGPLGLVGGVLGAAGDKQPVTLYRSPARALPAWELCDVAPPIDVRMATPGRRSCVDTMGGGAHRSSFVPRPSYFTPGG